MFHLSVSLTVKHINKCSNPSITKTKCKTHKLIIETILPIINTNLPITVTISVMLNTILAKIH